MQCSSRRTQAVFILPPLLSSWYCYRIGWRDGCCCLAYIPEVMTRGEIDLSVRFFNRWVPILWEEFPMMLPSIVEFPFRIFSDSSLKYSLQVFILSFVVCVFFYPPFYESQHKLAINGEDDTGETIDDISFSSASSFECYTSTIFIVIKIWSLYHNV